MNDDVLPISKPFWLSSVPRAGHEMQIRFTDEEAALVAPILGLDALRSFTASFRFKPEKKDIYLIRGQVSGEVEQPCVVTLEPVISEIEEAIDLRVRANAGSAAVAEALQKELDFQVDDTDPPEPLEADKLDLALLAVEFLALGIDPYPRLHGADLGALGYSEAVTDDDGEADKAPSPFQILQNLRDKKDA